MKRFGFALTTCVAMGTVLLAACATEPAKTADSPVSNTVVEPPTQYAIEKRFREAARSYRRVDRDGKTLYCRSEKVTGSTIPTMQCLTEAELRNQVEAMEALRRSRNTMGGCPKLEGCTGG